jgi:hypothetical protein
MVLGKANGVRINEAPARPLEGDEAAETVTRVKPRPRSKPDQA